MPHPDDKLLERIQEQARSCQLEGVIMASTPKEVREDVPNVKIITCGSSEDIDIFLDKVGYLIAEHEQLMIDTFLKDKDYRGVFRIMH